MNRVIIIHGWEEVPTGNWLPWVGNALREKGWRVEIPEMPNSKNPKLDEWMDMLVALIPDEHTVLIGHSLANALIIRFLERPESRVRRAVMVAAWDWLMEDVKEFHETFFKTPFDYEQIKQKHIPITIINSTNDPWIDLERSKPLAEKLGATFIPIQNAGHFMDRDGYLEFPKLVEIAEGLDGVQNGNGKDIYVDPRHEAHAINLPFWRDNNKLWALDVPVEEMRVGDFMWMFDIPFWEDEQGNIVIAPREVMENLDAYPFHSDKITNADASFPIDIMQNKNGKWITLDGLHRLVKLALEGVDVVKVRKIPPELIHLTARD